MANAPIQLKKVTPADVVAVPTGYVGLIAGSDGKFYAKDGSGASVATATENYVDDLVTINDVVNSMSIGRANLAQNSTISAGYDCLTEATLVTDSVFIGSRAGAVLETGNGNTVIGNLTLNTIVTTNGNTVIGDAAGRFLETGGENLFGGYISATAWINGQFNVVLGAYTGAYNSDGDFNVLIGGYAGAQSEIVTSHLGDYNVGIGFESMLYGEGNNVIGIGYQSAYQVRGDDVICIGRTSGSSLTHADATDAIFIGRAAGNAAGQQKADAINVICIGADTFATQDNEIVIGNGLITKTTIRGTEINLPGSVVVSSLDVSANGATIRGSLTIRNGASVTGYIFNDSTVLVRKYVVNTNATVASPEQLYSYTSRGCYTNVGASAEVGCRLNSATVGDSYEFVVSDADGLRITAGASDRIRDVGTLSALGGYIRSSTLGSTLTLTCVQANVWVVSAKNGTWTIDS